MQDPVDLRSDTVTRPTPAMRRAMADAEVGDDVYGEDPTTRRLEAEAAARFSKEAAVFVPSGTMANQIAIHVWCRPGDQVILGRDAHSVLYETGGAAALSGVMLDVIPTALFTAADVASRYNDGSNVHACRTPLVMVENTHNRGGGLVFPIQDLEAIHAVCRDRRVALHMDGARVFNAVIASGVSTERWGREVDSLCFCLSKGLGAPVGSLLVGDRDFIREARRARKRFGGGMRQVGILAAAGLHALTHHVERLAEDHARARRLAAAWDAMEGVSAVGMPETNLLYLQVDRADLDAPNLCGRLAELGVRVSPVGPRLLRAVLHLDVDDAGVERAVEAMARVLG